MVKKIKKLFLLPSQFSDMRELDGTEDELFQYFNSINPKKSRSKDIVLLECVEDPFYFGLFGQVVSSIKERQDISAQQILVNSFRVGESVSLNKFFFYGFLTRLLKKKWCKLYSSFCDSVAYDHTDLSHPMDDIIDLYRSYKCWKSINTKDELIALKIDSIAVGDLINDTYLRYKPAPTVNLSVPDMYLWSIIWQTYRNIRRGKRYFSRVKPKAYLTSYSTYVNHGIPVRIALKSNVPVFAISSNLQQFIKPLSENDTVHTKDPDNYASDFNKLNDQEEKLAQAELALNQRITGSIDNSTAYMKKSAYAQTDIPVPDVSRAVVIFMHDFFDSPHVYRSMVFPDFWEWVCFTIDTLKQANIKYFLKPHPNQINLSNNVMEQLKQKYPDMLLIPPDITNKQLVDAGIICAITVYGTVAHEMAFLGVPTITSANHPHSSFDFCINTKDKFEYADALKRSSSINFDKIEMKNQSLKFYYMHNLNLSDEEKQLNDAVLKLRFSDINDGNDMVQSLKQIAELSGYKQYIAKIMA